MARPQKIRKIASPPAMTGFKPFGLQAYELEVVTLKLEEYESFRMIDYDGLSQDQAAAKMNISRPTFTRLYNRALKSIAKAFVEGRAIEMEGGNFILEREWYRCRKCFRLIEGLENHIPCQGCTRFGKEELIKINFNKV